MPQKQIRKQNFSSIRWKVAVISRQENRDKYFICNQLMLTITFLFNIEIILLIFENQNRHKNEFLGTD